MNQTPLSSPLQIPVSSLDPYQYSSSLVLHYVEAECEISTTSLQFLVS